MATQFGRAHRLWVGFLAAVVVLVGVLAWLGWRIAVQDEQLSAVRSRAAAENSVDLAVAALERHLVAVEQDLAVVARGGDPIHVPADSDGAVVVRISSDAFFGWPNAHVAFRPDETAPAVTPDVTMSDIDALQFGKRDYHAAIALLQPLADRALTHRETYLARLGQNQLAAGQPEAALVTYRRLVDMRDSEIAGMPAALAGRLGVLRAADAAGDVTAAHAVAQELDGELASGRWRLSRASFDVLAAEVRRRVPNARAVHAAPALFAEQAARVWDACGAGQCGRSGRSAVEDEAVPLVVLWLLSGRTLAVYVADAGFVYQHWLGAERQALTLSNPDGRRIAGIAPAASKPRAIRLASDTRLPWTIAAAPVPDAQELRAERTRKRLIAAGLSVLLTLMVTCTVLAGRAIGNELAVARLRSDFVSAVSHEFRTPLTTLCQLSELLERGRVPQEQDRQTYYRYLRAESERLRRLVEGLLTFGRLQEGRASFHFQSLDAASFAESCVTEFQRAQTRLHPITLETAGGPFAIEADPEALRCALWNLLENAVKYSPEPSTVRVSVHQTGDRVGISVADRGFGVHPAERDRIFERFVRGRAAMERAITGTGIGLATAREILRAHRGHIAVESDGSSGSTFTLLLPVRA